MGHRQTATAPDVDFDEYRFAFDDTFAKTNAPLGSNSLQEAIRRAASYPLPAQAARYTSPKLRRLVAVCYQLHHLQGRSTFFLGVRDAARILDIKNLYQASAILSGLVRDGVLIVVEKGTRKRATRFRYKLLATASGGNTNDTPPIQPHRLQSCLAPSPLAIK